MLHNTGLNNFRLSKNVLLDYRDSDTIFVASAFFYKSSSPKPLKIVSVFKIFSQICGDIRKSRCTTGIKDTGEKFAVGVNYTSDNDNAANLPLVPLVMLILVANLPLFNESVVNNGNNIRLLKP
jgi:hypothetical protein